jgi:hypothetical protein
MKKINDKIILYLDNQMSDDEKLVFEDELKSSETLRLELEDYKNFLGDLKKVENIPIDENYFSQMIPKFRGRMEERRKFLSIPKFALGITTIAAILVLVIFTSNNKNLKNINSPVKTEIVQNNNSGLTSLLGNNSDQLNLGILSNDDVARYDSVFNSMISNALSLSPQSVNYLTADNNTDLSNMLQGINQKEADEIYNQLLHKKIF